VTFSAPEEAEACFALGYHTVDGSKVEIKRVTPKDETPPSGPRGEFLRKVIFSVSSIGTLECFPGVDVTIVIFGHFRPKKIGAFLMIQIFFKIQQYFEQMPFFAKICKEN
jgi:hypothetical protein